MYNDIIDMIIEVSLDKVMLEKLAECIASSDYKRYNYDNALILEARNQPFGIEHMAVINFVNTTLELPSFKILLSDKTRGELYEYGSLKSRFDLRADTKLVYELSFDPKES